jgi:hypothetical protein
MRQHSGQWTLVIGIWLPLCEPNLFNPSRPYARS